MNPAQVARKFDDRAGYRLTCFGLVGLPVYRITSVAPSVVGAWAIPRPRIAMAATTAMWNQVETMRLQPTRWRVGAALCVDRACTWGVRCVHG